jgi:hypothetical protein
VIILGTQSYKNPIETQRTHFPKERKKQKENNRTTSKETTTTTTGMNKSQKRNKEIYLH